ncbi:MAG: clostripain-related cysteine peptidase [Armatimonadota bacterium]|nr:clostripain-related cysteine peptidase [Armatimonadota bacterium]
MTPQIKLGYTLSGSVLLAEPRSSACPLAQLSGGSVALNRLAASVFLAALSAFACLFLGGCGGSGHASSGPGPGPVEWTVLVFLNADNDLEEFGILNMNQMEIVGSTSRVNIVVQMDRIVGHDSTNGDWTGARRYFVTRDKNQQTINSTLLEDMGEADMGNPDTLRQFIEWGKQNYPANRYALVIWNHGSGWRGVTSNQAQILTRDVSYDDTSNTQITTADLPAALATAPRLDLVAFDASLMQMLEVAYEIRDSAGVVVGSEESPPGEGYPYHRWLGRLTSNPTMSANSLGAVIVSEYVNYYAGRLEVTQSAVQTDKLADLAAAASAFADALLPHAVPDASALASARDLAQDYVVTQYKDLRHYSELVEQRLNDPAVTAATDALTAALGDAIIREAHTGSSLQNSHGLSIWVPTPSEYADRQAGYAGLQFAADSQWDEWLAAQRQ